MEKIRIAPKALNFLVFLKAKHEKVVFLVPFWAPKMIKLRLGKNSKDKSWGENSPDFGLNKGVLTVIAR